MTPSARGTTMAGVLRFKWPGARARFLARALAFAAAATLPPAAAAAQTTGAVEGVTTTQTGAVRLPGVTVTLTHDATARAATTVSDGEGRFRFAGLAPGRYRARASLASFATVERAGLEVAAGRTLTIELDLPIDARTETVDVVSTADSAARATASSRDVVQGALVDVAPLKGDDFRSLLPILPGVVRGPDGRVNLKGGRPTQTGLQVSHAYAGDPSTGDFGFDLPVDAVESVEIQPNPFAAEYGRFSSGVARIETRAGGDRWRATFNNPLPMPCLKICDGRTWGVRRYGPRFIVGGPVVRDRLFLSQSLQYRYVRERTPGLPDEAADFWLRSFDALTRLDLRPGGGHQITGLFAVFPRNVHFLNLSTLNPQEATPNFRQRGYDVLVSDTAALSASAVLESTFNFKRYNADVSGQGETELTFTPEGTRGNFFNTQRRRTRTIQWIETLTLFRTGAGGEHLLKAGFDLLHADYRGASESRPVLVRRADGTLSQRIEFAGPTAQRVGATDVAVFVQDRWRPNDRLLLEGGLRLEHDGVTGRTNASPRLGFVAGVLPGGRGVLRGGIGRFFERTPLIVEAFESFEAQTVTRFGPDGVTPAGPPLAFAHRSGAPFETPSAGVWNLEYDHRLAPGWLLRVNHLRRAARHEFLVHPRILGDAAELRLDDNGASSYHETDVTLRYDGAGEREVTVTYVHSRSEGDLNAYDRHFGNLRHPIIRANERGRRSIDVPHRLLVVGVWPVAGRWTVSPVLEVRSGFPYSLLDENQDFVGPRNGGGRFPRFVSLDLAVNRYITIRGREIRIGAKAFHAFNTFMPRTVQSNIDAPGFGTFHDSILRKFGLAFEIRP